MCYIALLVCGLSRMVLLFESIVLRLLLSSVKETLACFSLRISPGDLASLLGIVGVEESY
jgi:hypothetical protein